MSGTVAAAQGFGAVLLDLLSALWQVTGEMSPWLLFGFVFAGLLSLLLKQQFVLDHLGRPGVAGIVKASVLGVPLPLCSCSVIPVSALLRKAGASKGAVASFLISTPQTGVDSILVTYSLMGLPFAVFRAVFAFVSGVVGGVVVEAGASKTAAVNGPSSCSGECCGSSCHDAGPPDRPPLSKAAIHALVEIPRDIGKPLLLGLAITALIGVFVPEGFFAEALGTGLLAMLVMLLVGLPMYVCATASVPIAAVLIAKGITPGAAMVFLMTGPATNAAAMTTLWKLLGPRETLLYLASVVVTAVGSGLLFDLLGPDTSALVLGESGELLPDWFTSLCSVLLLLLIANAVLRRPAVPSKPDDEKEGPMETIVVKGMTCGHCSSSVEKAVRKVAGVTGASVDLKAGTVALTGSYDRSAVIAAIRRAGFETE